MSAYLVLKFLHIVGAAILFGTGLGIAFFQFRADRQGDPVTVAATLRTVVLADYVFTATAVVAQPVTGFLLAKAAGYSLSELWIVASLALYVLTGLCWLPVVAIQIEMRNLAAAAVQKGRAELPARYHRLMRLWFWLGWPAFLSVLAIFWLMIARPA